MDSVTQAALGAAVAGMIAGRKASPKVLVAGAMLGTLPDLDVLIDYGDPVSDMVKHRGFSHSLFVLFPLSLLLAWCWHRWRPASSFSFLRLWGLVAACLITHPILDAFTAYGTQLLWPLPVSVAVSSIFIIDPLYTLPLLVTLLAALLWRDRIASLCKAGVILSSLYLLWSVVAMHMIEQRVENQVAGTPLEGKPVFVSPTPFNTVLWRIVVLGEDSYWEGLSSLLDGSDTVDFLEKARGHWPLTDKPSTLQALERFTRQFIRYEDNGSQIIATDLRLGMVDYLPFRFVFASRENHEDWQFPLPVQLSSPAVRIKHLPSLWLRLLGSQDIDADLCHASEACHHSALPSS
ncbi:metal-dependent hydrolase [Photobacterium sp. WH77]|uniref:metal-dependent hydrolase n=1 Tax=unclassified Photobacterium TaxID=2628852 RepID=UPI001EDC6FE8|nr:MULTISPECIES: metal-dependent hydrolase [unclassified Photobacterium]MCG2835851.1 metal-dependent hydrolase [Photobacterium sp. WH77]MCG2843472.1 metal-dependent hydrolase [Photobacterium sp. WH80]